MRITGLNVNARKQNFVAHSAGNGYRELPFLCQCVNFESTTEEMSRLSWLGTHRVC